MTVDKKSIALALSGGGIRAMAFHLGVLKRMAENQLLERVTRVSTVSGGSLLIGLVLKERNLRWPTSAAFLEHSYPTLRDSLCSRSLQWGAARQLLRPSGWPYLLSRANLLALALREEWGVSDRLADLPSSPEWSINGTNAHNGRRFRFKRDTIGDYVTGYAGPNNLPLASAMAVSAAFPGGFGPLTLRTEKFCWTKREWDAPAESAQAVVPVKRLHLYDGGVYDNLGLEPFFDAGRGKSKLDDRHVILVSDAGKPLPSGHPSGSLNPERIKRIADIMSDQSHALRVRTFIHYSREEHGRGGFVYIADPTTKPLGKSDHAYAAAFPTTLRKLTPEAFDRLSVHGYNLASELVIAAG